MAQNDDATELVLQTVNGMADAFQNQNKEDQAALFFSELIRGFVVEGIERDTNSDRPQTDFLQMAARAYLKANPPR